MATGEEIVDESGFVIGRAGPVIPIVHWMAAAMTTGIVPPTEPEPEYDDFGPITTITRRYFR